MTPLRCAGKAASHLDGYRSIPAGASGCTPVIRPVGGLVLLALPRR
jgi:hypothetical protein